MSKKDYERLAAWLKSSAPLIGLVDWQLELLVQRLCFQVLIPDNVRFDADRFVHAVCGTGLPIKEDK